ncbi:acyltransferase [Streptococcus thermophilus]|uniref:acyltransferase n=1 Tax=Streptococcus thermophilus TaxID=1308 RepID=UPI001E606EA1|nr:acyltransferase [Streptococcus thermophilus]
MKFESFSEIQGLASEGLIFGDNVMIGPKCSLFAENHNFSSKKLTIKEQGVNQKGIVIEDDCWIGSNVIILDGVKISRGSVIGAGSLVSKDIPAGSIYINKRNINIRQR